MELYRTRSGAVWPRLPHSQLGSAKLRCPPILLPEVRHLAIEGDLVMAAFAKRVLHLFNRGLEMVAGIVNRTLSLSFENCPQNMNCNVSLTELDAGSQTHTLEYLLRQRPSAGLVPLAKPNIFAARGKVAFILGRHSASSFFASRSEEHTSE